MTSRILPAARPPGESSESDLTIERAPATAAGPRRPVPCGEHLGKVVAGMSPESARP